MRAILRVIECLDEEVNKFVCIGRVYILDFSDDVDELTNLHKNFRLGMRVKSRSVIDYQNIIKQKYFHTFWCVTASLRCFAVTWSMRRTRPCTI